MPSHGVVSFAKVRAMLLECAPGHELILKKHRHWVRFNDRTYRGLPKIGHGKPEVKIGTVESMVNFLDIDRACARGQIAALRF
jgi:hypothetical protein